MSTTDKRQPTSRAGPLQTDRRTVSAIREKLGEQLRAMYGKLEDQPFPEHLRDLLRQLDQPRSGGKP